MATIPSEWRQAIQWLASRFTSTAIYADRKFRESELDDILPTWRNRDALFEYLEHARAISPKRAGLYTVVLPDLGSPDDPATHVTNRIQLPMSYELRDILPAILELTPAVDPEPAANVDKKTPKRGNTPRGSRTSPEDCEAVIQGIIEAFSGDPENVSAREKYEELLQAKSAKEVAAVIQCGERKTIYKTRWFREDRDSQRARYFADVATPTTLKQVRKR